MDLWFKEFGIPEMYVQDDYFRILVEIIISQQISVKAADAIYGRFRELIENDFNPARVKMLSLEECRRVGLSKQKFDYVNDLARSFDESPEDYTHLNMLGIEELNRVLLRIKGIGPWTVEMFRITALGDLDVLSAGDLGLRNALIKFYDFPKEQKPIQFARYAERWKPFRSVASLMLWKALGV